jgi:O-antigen/teichoic acid export membrane protein
MTSTSSVVKGGATLWLGQIVAQVCTLIRSVTVARLISPHDYGIAATFMMTWALVEMVSSLAADSFLIQAEDGDAPSLQATLHLLQVLRGLFNATIIFALAGIFADLFGIPDTAWAFRCLALLPLIKGFGHRDVTRLQRDMEFLPFVLVDAGSNIAATLLALPLVLYCRDYSAMLWISLAQTVCFTAGSHLVARRSYVCAWHTESARRLIAFGWPLLVNGVLVLAVFDGERFVIATAPRFFEGSTLSLNDVAIYSVAFTLAQAPALLISNVASSLFLPFLSRIQDSRHRFESRYLGCLQALALVAAAVVIPAFLIGGTIVTAIYGDQYASGTALIGWLSAMWGVRILRAGPTLAAMALGDTRNAMTSNMVRTAALGGALFVAATGKGLLWIAISGTVAELMACAVGAWRLRQQHGVAASLCLRPFGLVAVGVALAGLALVAGADRLGLVMGVLASMGLVAGVFFMMLATCSRLQTDVTGFVSEFVRPFLRRVREIA